jgi:8-oxo-dGTP diphosphatase
MPPPYCYEYPRPAVTVDLAVFCLQDETLHVLMVRRDRDPFAGRRALPGGFLDIDERIEDAALRELREETGLDLDGPIYSIGVFGEPGRDPRGRTISLSFATAVRGPTPRVGGADDAAEASWLAVDGLGDLAFDHDEILADALNWLIVAVEVGPVGLVLLPAEFTDADAKALHRALDLPDSDAPAWRQRLLQHGQILPLGGKPRRFRAVVEEDELA